MPLCAPALYSEEWQLSECEGIDELGRGQQHARLCSAEAQLAPRFWTGRYRGARFAVVDIHRQQRRRYMELACAACGYTRFGADLQDVSGVSTIQPPPSDGALCGSILGVVSRRPLGVRSLAEDTRYCRRGVGHVGNMAACRPSCLCRLCVAPSANPGFELPRQYRLSVCGARSGSDDRFRQGAVLSLRPTVERIAQRQTAAAHPYSAGISRGPESQGAPAPGVRICAWHGAVPSNRAHRRQSDVPEHAGLQLLSKKLGTHGLVERRARESRVAFSMRDVARILDGRRTLRRPPGGPGSGGALKIPPQNAHD